MRVPSVPPRGLNHREGRRPSTRRHRAQPRGCPFVVPSREGCAALRVHPRERGTRAGVDLSARRSRSALLRERHRRQGKGRGDGCLGGGAHQSEAPRRGLHHVGRLRRDPRLFLPSSEDASKGGNRAPEVAPEAGSHQTRAVLRRRPLRAALVALAGPRRSLALLRGQEQGHRWELCADKESDRGQRNGPDRSPRKNARLVTRACAVRACGGEKSVRGHHAARAYR